MTEEKKYFFRLKDTTEKFFVIALGILSSLFMQFLPWKASQGASGLLSGAARAQAASAGSNAAPSPTGTPVPDAINKITKKLTNDNLSVEQKTNFLKNYILKQREPVLDFLRKLLIAVIVFIVLRWLFRLVMKLVKKSMTAAKVDLSVSSFIMSCLKVAFYALDFFICASILGVAGSTIVAIVGSASLAVGLALQGSLANFAGGVLILILKPFKVGDYIVSDQGEGTVTSIDIFYTRVTTSENTMIVMPNGNLSNNSVKNITALGSRMLVLNFFADDTVNFENLKKNILYDMYNISEIHQDRPRQVIIDSFFRGGMKLTVKCEVNVDDYWDIREILNEKIRKRMDDLKKNEKA